MKSLGRTSAMVRKELRELARRPGAILSLILGPLVVMALFGAGFTGERNTFRAIVVVPAGSELPQDVEYYRQMAGRLVIIADVVGDVSTARARLGHDDIRLLVITPKDIRKHLEAGEQATLEVDWNELDPLEDMAASSAANEVGHALNQEGIVVRTGHHCARSRSCAASDWRPRCCPRSPSTTPARRSIAWWRWSAR